MSIEVILLAAGQGRRLQPITNIVPKCLVPICGRPLLEIWLENLNKIQVSRIHLNLHHFPEKVLNFINQNKYENIQTHYETELLGTAGSIRRMLQNVDSKTVLIAHADNLTVFSLDSFLEKYFLRPKECIGTMMLFKTDRFESCGIVDYDHANSKILGYVEKPEKYVGDLANGAVYLFDSSAIQERILKTDYDFSKDFVARHFTELNGFVNDTLHMDIGTIETFLDAQNAYLKASSDF
tara:strand:+ start:411 stop:1124 length:714 start_codon:yes stop_codon:yes gene_type:complete